MLIGTVHHGRAWLYERKHPVMVYYVQPAILFIGSALCFLALFVLEGIALGAGFIAVAWVALKVFG
jgi:hypothetical protein